MPGKCPVCGANIVNGACDYCGYQEKPNINPVPQLKWEYVENSGKAEPEKLLVQSDVGCVLSKQKGLSESHLCVRGYCTVKLHDSFLQDNVYTIDKIIFYYNDLSEQTVQADELYSERALAPLDLTGSGIFFINDPNTDSYNFIIKTYSSNSESNGKYKTTQIGRASCRERV